MKKGMDVGVHQEAASYEQPFLLRVQLTRSRETGSDVPKSRALEIRNDEQYQGFGYFCDYWSGSVFRPRQCEIPEKQNQLSRVSTLSLPVSESSANTDQTGSITFKGIAITSPDTA